MTMNNFRNFFIDFRRIKVISTNSSQEHHNLQNELLFDTEFPDKRIYHYSAGPQNLALRSFVFPSSCLSDKRRTDCFSKHYSQNPEFFFDINSSVR